MITAEEDIFRIKGISKHFGGIKALENISFGIRAGEIHAIVGENGAGKSTLMNILAGSLVQDQGDIHFDHQRITQQTPRKMQDLGVAMVYQELNLLPHRDVVQNVFLGRERTRHGVVLDYPAMRAETIEQLKRLGIDELPGGPVKNLPMATLQLVEIAKALLHRAKVVIMDEPNSALSEQESLKLFSIIRSLKNQGIAIIYISHRLEEVVNLADRITVLRDGNYIATVEAQSTSVQEIVAMMLGRRLDNMYPARKRAAKTEPRIVLAMERVTKRGKVQDINLTLRAGEVVGVFGLEGSGRQEIAEILYGLIEPDEGHIQVNGNQVRIRSPMAAKTHGIAYVPPDRKWEGLVLGQSIRTNISLPILARISRFGIIRGKRLNALVRSFAAKLNLKCSSMFQKVSDLSGGNQQKVVLSKALATEPAIIILSEPTRGIDIGAKREIYMQIYELAAQGLGVLFISSELPEVMALCDRIFVISAGTIRAEVRPDETDDDHVLALACGA